MLKSVILIQGLLELLGLSGFLVGYFTDIWWLMVVGGCLVVLDDVIEISLGVLNPIFPILLAIILAVLLMPWYVGVFWASAAFKVLGLPNSLKKIFKPGQLAVKVEENNDTFNGER